MGEQSACCSNCSSSANVNLQNQCGISIDQARQIRQVSACRYGNPQMWHHCGTCCGLRPHFNWVVATCEAGPNNIQQSDESVLNSDELLKQHMLGCWVWLGHESSNISRGDPGPLASSAGTWPQCVIDGSPKINYVAAYQFDGTKPGFKRAVLL